MNLISNEVNNNSSVREKTLSKNDESAKIMITGWGSSSFIIRMKLPCSEAQENHPSDDRKRRLLACLEGMFSDDIPEDQLADLIDGHGGKKSLQEASGKCGEPKAIIKLRTKSNPYGNKLTFPRAKERIKRIDELAKESTNIELTGQLVGGSLESKKFQLKVGEKIYSGNVTLDAHQQMKDFRFGDTVHAIVEETRKYAKRSKNTITLTYKLDSIFRVENNSPDENRSV